MSSNLDSRYGFGPAFAAEWRRQWGSDLRELMEAPAGSTEALWNDFALSANLRGREMATDVAMRLSRGFPSLQGRRALDIGCGIGGTAVALASFGADVVGFDLDEDRVRLAAANATDHGASVAVSTQDLLDPGLDVGLFDAIVAEDVLEHVADAEAGTEALGRLLAPGGLARVTIPNGDAAPFVVADGHYLLPGLTLLRDRELAAAYFDASFEWGEYDVGNYHSFDEYSAWFADAGLDVAEIVEVDVAEGRLDDELARAEAAVAMAAGDPSLPEGVRRGLQDGWDAYRGRVATAQAMGPAAAQLRIGTRFWRFYLANGEPRRPWSFRPPNSWAWRGIAKRVPGLTRLVRAIRR